jgi:hypothetical protein
MLTAPRLGFPRRTPYLVLPGANPRAARAGLALYTSLYPHQVVAASTARLLLRLGAGDLLRLRRPADLPDPEAWAAWCKDVATPVVGEIADAAVLFGEEGRASAILFDAAGAPVGFLKLRPACEADDVEPVVVAALRDGPLRTFRTPRVLVDSYLEGRHARLLEPLPEGLHRRPPRRPDHLAALVDELQLRLAELPKPADTPSWWRPAHGDLTPRNVRLAADGWWWVFDWEYFAWAPRLTDELRYWAADFGFRSRPKPARDGRRILELLRRRGSDEEIVEALRWPLFNQPIEKAMRDEVARFVGADPNQ